MLSITVQITSFASKSAQPVDSGDFDCFSVNSRFISIH